MNSIQVPFGDNAKAKENVVDGKCAMEGGIGNIMMDLFITSWLKKGNKLVSSFFIFSLL